MNHELKRLGIQVKTIVPGIVITDVQRNGTTATGSPHEQHIEHVLSRFSSPETFSVASQPAETATVVFEATTDGRDRTRTSPGPRCPKQAMNRHEDRGTRGSAEGCERHTSECRWRVVPL